MTLDSSYEASLESESQYELSQLFRELTDVECTVEPVEFLGKDTMTDEEASVEMAKMDAAEEARWSPDNPDMREEMMLDAIGRIRNWRF
jgi:hypothetical protein